MGDSARRRLLVLTVAAVAAVAALVSPARAQDQADATLGQALIGGKPSLDLRYRFEFVDQDGIAETAKANTVRARLGYETGKFLDTWLYADAEILFGIGRKRFNDTVDGDVRFPVVADPSNSEINQYYIANQSLPETVLKLGRQRIILDNHRFVGNVGWRQNEQTFDALRATSKLIPDVTADYAYVYLVNRVFGEDSPVGDFESDSHLINLAYDGWSLGKITVYAYLVDLGEAPAFSNQSYGARFAGRYALGEPWALLYALEGAWQSDYGRNPASNDFAYYLIEPGIAYDSASARLGYEVLSGDGTRAFQTPLATLHAFQGWADKFLVTPGGGIEDLYLRLDYVAKGLGWLDGTRATGAYHWYWAEQTGRHYGDELNLEIARTLYEHFTVGIKYAFYDADRLFTDTHKLWLSFEIKY